MVFLEVCRNCHNLVCKKSMETFFCAVTFILLLNNNYLNQFIYSQFPSYHFIQGNYNIDMQLKTLSRLVRLPKCTCLFFTSMLTCLIKCNTKRVQLNAYKSVMPTNYTVAYKLLSLWQYINLMQPYLICTIATYMV